MSYTNPGGTSNYTLTAASGGLLVFNSATGVTYTTDPYAKYLVLSANGKTFNGVVVSSGGTLYTSKGAANKDTIKNLEVSSGGVVSGNVGAFVQGLTVHSGGKVHNAAFSISGMVLESGAIFSNAFTGACRFNGATGITIDQGAHVYSGTVEIHTYTDENGWWHNFQNWGACHLEGGIKLADPLIRSWLYFSSGCVLSGGTNSNKGGDVAPILFYGATGIDFRIDSAKMVNINVSGVTLGGSRTHVTNTPFIYVDGKILTTGGDPGLTITEGVIEGLVLKEKNGTANLVDLSLIDGITAKTPQISAGGSLTVWKGATLSGTEVNSGGQLKITSGGFLYGGTVHSGGSLTVNYASNGIRAYASGTVVESGGYVLVRGSGIADNFQVAAGATFELQAHVTLMGAETNVAQGAFYVPALGGYRETLRVENGVMLGLNDETMAIHIRDGFKVSGGEFKGYFHVSNGAYVNQVVFKPNGTNAGGAVVSVGGVVENATVVSGGDIRMYGGLLSGATVKSGAILKFYTGAGTIRGGVFESGLAALTMNAGATVDGTEVHNAVVVNSGASFVNNNVLGAGAYVSAAKGAYISGAVFSRATGTVLGFYDGNAQGVSQGRAAMSAADIDFRAGTAVLRGSNVYGDNLRVSGGVVHLQNGGHFTNVTIYNGGEVQCYANDTVGEIGQIPVEAKTDMHLDGVTVSGGSLRVDSFGNASNVTVYGGTAAIFRRDVYGSGGYMTKLVQSGGSVIVAAGGLLESATLYKNAEMEIRNHGTATSVTANSGANIYISGGALAEHLVFTDSATVTASEGGTLLRDVDIQFVSGGKVSLYNGAVISNVTVSAVKKDLNALMVYAGAVASDVQLKYGYVYLYAGGTVSGGVCSNGAMIARGGGDYHDVTVLGGQFTMQNGGSAYNIVVSGGICEAGDRPSLTPKPIARPAYLEGVDLFKGTVRASSGGVLSAVRASGGTVDVISGAAYEVTVLNGAKLLISSGGQVTDADVRAGGRIQFTKDGAEATIMGAKTNIAQGAMYYNTTALTASVKDGVLTGFTPGTEFKLSIGDDILVKDVELNNGEIRVSCFDGASVDGATVSAGAIICNAGATGTMDNVTLVKAGIMNLSGTAKANNTTVLSGGQFAFHTADASAENTTVMANGKLVLKVSANTGDRLTLDFTGAGAGAETKIDYLGRIAGSTTVFVAGVEQAVGIYYLGSGGALYDSATSGTLSGVTQKWGLYENALVNGGTYDDALNGVTYSFNGTAITTTALTIATGEAAGLAGGNYTELRTNDRAAKWTSGAGATLVTESFNGDAWLEVAGDVTGAIYGAAVDFANTVNINAKSGTIRNLAAGATAGGTVGAVKLTFDGADLDGAGYAGGFGNVTGNTETLITTGSFAKDFYAGALANKLATATSVDDVSLTIEGGTFSGNIYGASAVKTTSATSDTRHTADNVTLTVTGGSTTKGGQACIFAGGYATGEGTGRVYTVTSVTAEIAGGSWGTAAGGRGVFGGVMASGVEAAVTDDVNLTISGGTMGNVYGGGWAQKENGKSIVGNVNISIEGGTMANVFGGGSHSTTGGTTTAGNVTITVSGGSITNAIYARGQLANDDVTGTVGVTFTGDKNFTFTDGVYGYTATTGEQPSTATLGFEDYTGTFSGKVGGFNGITLDKGTAMTLMTAAADVSNSKWEFDLSARDAALANDSLLIWSNADFASDTVKVNFADETQAKAGWSIATAAFAATTTFTLEIAGADIGSAAYGQAITGTGTAYDGWGFTRENDVLKFKNLA